MKRLGRFIVLLLVFLSLIAILFTLQATDYQPWVGSPLELEWEDSLQYQHYHLNKRRLHDLFLNISVNGAYQDINIELEIKAAHTKKQPGAVDQLRITAKNVLTNDIIGDPFTSTIGCSLTQAFHKSVRDPGSFHHGYNEAELFFSIGKELLFSENWESRIWGIAGIGTAIDRGSPWLHLESAYEKRWQDKQEGKISLQALYGLGHRKLRSHHFRGYGPIHHQSIDLNISYTYLLDFFGQTSITYCQRLYAYHYPKKAYSITFQLLYLFGIGEIGEVWPF